MHKHLSQNTRREQGFTLIEMAVVIMVIGLIIAAAAPIYKQYRDDVAKTQTAEAVRSVSEAIGSFRNSRGRYPCPAPLTAAPGDPAYGHEEASCRALILDPVTNETRQANFDDIPVGTCDDGICTQEVVAGRTYDDDNNPLTPPVALTLDTDYDYNAATPPVPMRVRIGAVPFRQLGLEEEDSLDGYHNRLYYVVTEGQAQQLTFRMDIGAIDILKDGGASALTPAGSAHFLVYSAGQDSAGAFTYEGTQTPCPAAGTAQGQNCDFNAAPPVTTATFNSVQRSDAVGNQKFDDIMSWSTMSGIPQWQTVEDGSQNPNIRQIEDGNVGANVAPGTSLTNESVVQGQIKAKDAAMVKEICKKGTTNCFPSTLVSEDNPSDFAEGEKGIKCPAGFMAGIANNVATCITDPKFGCDEGYILKGFDGNGDPDCDPSPSMAACGAEPVTVCTPQVLPPSPHNTTITLTGGTCRTSVYRCNDGAWLNTSNTGRCTFTPAVTHPLCGGCQSGNQTVTTQCVGANIVDRSACTCNAALPSCGPKARNVSCTSAEVRARGFTGYWTGSISQNRNYTCPATIGWSAWDPVITDTVVTSKCVCAGSVTQHEDCPPGLTGTGRDVTYPVQKVGKACILDTSSPTYNPATPACSCTNDVQYRDKDCPDGQAPATPESRTYNCSSTPPKWGNWSGGTCAPIVCTWKKGAFGGVSSTGRAPVGSSCTCGSSGQCSEGGGNSFNIYNNCQCTSG